MKSIASFLLIASFIFPFSLDAQETPPGAKEPDIRDFEPSNSAPASDTLPYYEKGYEVGSDNFKPLSMKKGMAWALSPFNGAGLIYTGHRISGITLLVIEGLIAVPLGLVGAALMTQDGGAGDVGQSIFFVGLGVFGVTYAIDAIATPVFIKRHNEHLKSARARPVTPYVTYQRKTDEFQAGIRFQF